MTVLTAVASLPYKAVRYPYQLVESRLVTAYLPEESSIRLAYERMLGSLDSTAGALFHDEGLKRRGQELRYRTEKVKKVVALEEKAAERRAEAAAKLEREKDAAAKDKARIQQEHEAEAARLKAEREAEKQAIARKAAERQRADEDQILDKTEAILAAERDRLDAEEARVEARVEVATQQPKKQLEKARKTAKSAKAKEHDAEVLSAMADEEKASR